MPRGKQLSPKTRGKIEALHSVGHLCVRSQLLFAAPGIRFISACNGFPMAAAIMKNDLNVGRQRQSGKITDRKAPSRLLSYQLADETGKQVSSRTVRRRLSETGVNVGGLEKTTANRKPSAFATGMGNHSHTMDFG